jgi:ribosome-associated toxin RatA of RatAB toxin-antitoxin module
MIEIRLVNGPFKQLEGFWRFEPYENAQCRIIFDLEFEFSNKLMAIAFETIFQQIAHSLVQAFSKPEDVYGPR